MIALLVLIVLTSAQECPYCRWSACTASYGSFASCSDCHTGALVTFQLDEDNVDIAPVSIGLCILCPQNCGTCAYTNLPQTGADGLAAVNCTSCVSGSTHDSSNGKCHLCPSDCTACVTGFSISAGANSVGSCAKDQSEGGRRLQMEGKN